MTTTSKQLRRKHRKSPKPRQQGHHPSRASGLERLHALEPAYIAWRSRTVTHGRAHEDWAGLLVLLESYAKIGPFNAPDALVPRHFSLMLNTMRRLPGVVAGQAMDRLDGYLHFLKDNGRWHRGDEVFDLLHMLVLIRVPGRAHRSTPHECPYDIALPHGQGIALVQWAAFLLDGMLEGRFSPRAVESLAYPVADPEGPVLLAPGLHPLPLSRFLDLYAAMGEADLFETAGDEATGDVDEYVEEAWENNGEPYPTHSGMALLQDDHPRNHDAIRSLLTAYLRILAMADATPASGMAGLRRAHRFMSVLADVATESSTAKAHGETNLLSLGQDIQDRLADRFGEISDAILACLEPGVVEYTAGTLVAQSVVREAIKDLHDEYVG
ncbi:hypothetical protein KRR55_17400 [Paeniglutamicibacter sp. ABSL32-1]|uniref:hypothetical protein n=1 Tax=Paeniglutamicibacter quisquiliarum TaxID=2849498 RepID=UPI001C2CF540|nr:hypothetical protein [Paeniglutamicibacter quisquiliarum]MBV1780893.1 hypothetical protein [Paeniglutamicibacter quisquiliarum]